MVAWRLARSGGMGQRTAHVEVKRGADAIFSTEPYPRTFDEFIGQPIAKDLLLTSMLSARVRQEPLDHCLFASGYPGIGKTALAKLVAATLEVGYVEVGGTVTVKDIRPVLHAMQDHDVLFIDEIHRLVAGGKRNIEWMLQLLQDGVLALPSGTERVPRITVIGATTDDQKLPQTILERFPIQPPLVPYSKIEAFAIARSTAGRLGAHLAPAQLDEVTAAANCNPRVIGRLLKTIRDIQVANLECQDIVEKALTFTGLSDDGLTCLSQDYLMLLYGYGGTAGIGTMRAALNTERLDQTERLLIQKGLIAITGKGRELTVLGSTRAQALLDANPSEE